MNRLNIAIFTESYKPIINGVVTHVSSLKSGLEALGHKVLIVTASTETKKHVIEDGILRCPSKKMKKLYGIGFASPISKKRLKIIKDFNPDIIHIHTEFGIGLFGMRAAKTLSVPLVYTLHTMYDEYIYYVVPRIFIPIVKKMAHKFFGMIAKRAVEVTGPSAKVQEYLDMCKANKNVHVIPNPVELDAFEFKAADIEMRNSFLDSLEIPHDATVCCFVGRLGKEKSVDKLIEYWKEKVYQDENVYLVIIGDGPAKEELELLAKDLGISDRCKFTGAISHDEISAYYRFCDIYVTASISDTNSISMLEGMASGLPVLQVTDKLNEGQVRDGINGYIFIDAEELNEKIQLIKNMDHDTLVALKESTRKSVENSGATTLGKNLENIYISAKSKNN